MSDRTRTEDAKSRTLERRIARTTKYGTDPRAARRSNRRSVKR